MHVLCYGAGAVGSLIGGRLALSGAASVTLLARCSHVAAVRTWGLALETPAGRVVCKAVDSITALDDLVALPDLVILTVKAYQTEEALADLAGLIKRDVTVLTLQNGVGNEEAIAAAGADATLSGVITISVSLSRPGVVRQNSASGGIALATVKRDTGVQDLANLFRQAGFRTAVLPDYRAMKWSKLLLNILGNASSAILQVPPQAVMADPRVFHAIEREAFLEAVRVIRALRLRPIALPGYPVPLLVALMGGPDWVARPVLARRINPGRGAKLPSLWEDLEKGRERSEVEVLNGAVAREGVRLGVPTPVNRLLAHVLLALASGRRDRQAFHRNPEALLSMLDRTPHRNSQ